MNLNKHSELEGRHAFLSPSKYAFLRYSDDKLTETFVRQLATQRGTQLHELANMLINLGVKLPNTQATLNKFVNDCIGYDVSSEQRLRYSDNCFGTADALKFVAALRDNAKSTLRVFDLKTGVTKTSFDQLVIYAALFCLEYGFKPGELIFDLRIYQNDLVIKYEEDPTDEVLQAMGTIVRFDALINDLKAEAYL